MLHYQSNCLNWLNQWNQLNWLNLSTVYYVFDTVSLSTRNSINFPFFMKLVPVTPFYTRSWTMAHLAGIDKGPVLDWVDDNGLMECYQIWKKRVEILFCGPLHAAGDGVKCNYLIYWAGKTGMDLVDKWETKGKLTEANQQHKPIFRAVWRTHLTKVQCSHSNSGAEETIPRHTEFGGFPHKSTKIGEGGQIPQRWHCVTEYSETWLLVA